MTKALGLIKRLATDETGAALVEYTFLLGTMVVAVIVLMTAIGGWVNNQWQLVCGRVGVC